MGAAEAAAEAVAAPNVPGPYEWLQVLFVALLSALASEALSYYFIYRKEEYQRLKAYLSRLGRMFERRQRELKAEKLAAVRGGGEPSKKPDKQLKGLERDLRTGQKDMTMLSMKLNLLIGVVTSIVFFTVQRRFYGHVIAKLPFTPFKLVQNLSHRGLPGDDPTDCSFMLLYVLANMGLRGSVQKLCGSAPLRVLDNMANPLLQDFVEEDEQPQRPAGSGKEKKRDKKKRH